MFGKKLNIVHWKKTMSPSISNLLSSRLHYYYFGNYYYNTWWNY